MSADSSQSPHDAAAPADRRPLIAFTWLWVGAPLAYGLYELVRKATQLFTG
ncbi:MFS transporter small subunit [Streptomyces sp. NPDC054808]